MCIKSVLKPAHHIPHPTFQPIPYTLNSLGDYTCPDAFRASFSAMCSGSEAVSYVRLIDSCVTDLKAQRPSRTCNASKAEEEEEHPHQLKIGLPHGCVPYSNGSFSLHRHHTPCPLDPWLSTLIPRPSTPNPKPQTPDSQPQPSTLNPTP